MIIAVIYGVVAMLSRDAGWYRRMSVGQIACGVMLGSAIAVAIEVWALASGRWSYDGMPLVPFTGVGLVPVLQMVILPPLILSIMRLSSGRPG